MSGVTTMKSSGIFKTIIIINVVQERLDLKCKLPITLIGDYCVHWMLFYITENYR